MLDSPPWLGGKDYCGVLRGDSRNETLEHAERDNALTTLTVSALHSNCIKQPDVPIFRDAGGPKRSSAESQSTSNGGDTISPSYRIEFRGMR